jgi:sarcosine oxidase subunit beta
MRARILIVGGGIMGLSTAWKCALRTRDPNRDPVVLLERGGLGQGSSGRSGAILRQHYRDPQIARMARDSLREYAGFEMKTGLPLGFQRSGVVTLAGPGQPEWVERVRENVAMLRELGVDTELVQGERLQALLPGARFAPGTVGAWEPRGGFVDPAQTLASFAAVARSAGAVTRLGVALEELVVEGGRVTGVRTSEGDYEADLVVLATGPWTRALLQRIGHELPLRVVRPENHYLAVPEMRTETSGTVNLMARFLSSEDFTDTGERPRPALGVHPVLIDLEHEVYARCDPASSRTRVGRIDYEGDDVLEDPDTLDETVSEAFKAWAREHISARLPRYAEREDAGSIAAWYTLTPDAQAIIDLVPGIENLLVVTGFSGHGFKLGPSVGEGVAQMLFGEPVTAFESSFFTLERFSDVATWGGRFGL